MVELDRKYHAEPSRMREHILKTLSGLPSDVDTVLAAMGFCGGSWQNVSCTRTLVIPRAADCVALALVTRERYSPDLKEPGHMYLFGEGDNGFSIRAIYENLLETYDKEMADIVFDMYFEQTRDLVSLTTASMTATTWTMWNKPRKTPCGSTQNWISSPAAISSWKNWYPANGTASSL